MKKVVLFSITLIIAGIVLYAYDKIAREIGIYFFWESKYVGIGLLLIGIAIFLINRINERNSKKKKAILETIGVVIVSLFFVIGTIVVCVLLNSDAYEVAKTSIRNDAKLKEEIGNINGFGFIPNGSIKTSSSSAGSVGMAIISLTVKGEKKFKDVTVHLTLDKDSPDWKIDTQQ
jgi:hypothetical protein